MKVAIIGGGVMGEAILAAALDRGVFDAKDVTVSEIIENRRNQLHSVYGVSVSAAAGEAMAGAGLTLLCVKPQEFHSVHGAMPADSLLLSIITGARIATIASEFKHDRIIRVVPNTPSTAKAGMSVWTASPSVNQTQRDLAQALLASIGRELYIDDEKKLDMVTAVGGSGPAYVFLFIEAMIDGAVSIGLSRAQAEEIVLQTVYGSAVYARESGRSAADLRAMVTSPAGTTAAGLLELERGGVRAAIIECIQAAHERAVELGGLA